MAVQPRLPPMNHYARATVTIVAVLAVLAAAWAVRNILLLVLVAAVLAVGLDPAVRRLERWHVRRGWAVFLIFFAAVAFIALFAALVVPPLVRQVTKLASDMSPRKSRYPSGSQRRNPGSAAMRSARPNSSNRFRVRGCAGKTIGSSL